MEYLYKLHKGGLKMTIEEAKQELPTFDSFADKFCNHCFNDIICNMDCKVIQKAEKMFDRVQQAYARHNGDIVKVDRYIKEAKI